MRGFVLTRIEKRLIIFALAAFAVGLSAKYYREHHFVKTRPEKAAEKQHHSLVGPATSPRSRQRPP